MIPGFGLLPEEFPDAYLRIFDLSDGDVAHFREDITIPLEPYFGTMGVCPAGAHDQSVLPPGSFGGNMDIRQTVRGSTLYLPVQVDDALFSCGDAHAAQGDGEVCVTAIESPMYAALRFTLDRGRSIPAPQFSTPGPLTRRVDSAPFYGTTGVNSDLYVAAQDAVRAMIDHLGHRYDLSREDAYLLCSLAVDLKISEIVDGGQYIVSALLPEAIFSSRSVTADGETTLELRARHQAALPRGRPRRDALSLRPLVARRRGRHADRILPSVRAGVMPCDGRWSDEQVGLLQRWIDGGVPE